MTSKMDFRISAMILFLWGHLIHMQSLYQHAVHCLHSHKSVKALECVHVGCMSMCLVPTWLGSGVQRLLVVFSAGEQPCPLQDALISPGWARRPVGCSADCTKGTWGWSCVIRTWRPVDNQHKCTSRGVVGLCCEERKSVSSVWPNVYTL